MSKRHLSFMENTVFFVQCPKDTSQCRAHPSRLVRLLVPALLFPRLERGSMGCGHDDGTPSRVPVGLLDDGRGVGANDTANGHEEATRSRAMSQCSSPLQW